MATNISYPKSVSSSPPSIISGTATITTHATSVNQRDSAHSQQFMSISPRRASPPIQMNTNSNQKTIVIIGAGFFGISCANRLVKLYNKNYSVKLVTLSNYTVLLPASARAAIQGRLENIVIPLKRVVDSRVEIIIDEVINFNEETVFLMRNGGSKIDYDSLVIATGAKWSDPIGTTYRYQDTVKDYFLQQAERYRKARDIVLIGGGYFSVELAGELLHVYKDEFNTGRKKLTLIHSGDKLLAKRGKYTEKFREKVTDYFIEKTPVRLMLNSRGEAITKDDGTKIVVVNGREIVKGDTIVFGVGVVPSVPPTEILTLCNDQGFIKVKETFQISSKPRSNIFAIGDVCDFEYKGLLSISEWEDVLVHNIQKVVDNPHKYNELSLQKTKRTPGIKNSIISLGPKNGIGQLVIPFLGPMFVPKWVSVMTKCKDLYAGNVNELYSA